MTALKLIIENKTSKSIESDNKFQFLKKNNPSLIHLDWDGAEQWNNELNVDVLSMNLENICRNAASIFILNNKVLIELVTYGREKLISSLSDDERQVFRNGGLLEKIPSPEVIEWWDKIRGLGRINLNEKLLFQGRQAERWTIELEQIKTANLGTEFQPVWVALDSDYYGYDILTYRKDSNSNITTLLIEVKSFSNPLMPQIYISRNEWEKSNEIGNNYQFIVWCTTTHSHKFFTNYEIAKHIPINQGEGTWQNVLVKLTNW